jgi:hypothetical protein
VTFGDCDQHDHTKEKALSIHDVVVVVAVDDDDVVVVINDDYF